MRAGRSFGARARVSPRVWLAALHAAETPPSSITAQIGHGRLMVVAPHPDDEVLACGGLIVRARAAGWPVQVIVVTDGECSHGRATRAGRARLARQRAHEQRRGLSALGLHGPSVVRLRLPDGGVGRHEAPLQRRLGLLLRPDDTVVVTTAWDGHPDHEAAARATRDAARAVGCTLWEAPVWLWQWAQVGSPGPPWQRLGRVELDGAAQRRKLRALGCHRSQQRPRGTTGQAVLCRDIRRRAAWPAEYFFDATR